MKIDILHEDDAILVVNKPSGVLTIPDRHDQSLFNLYHFLQEKYGEIFVVHRIDRETSGILVFARTEEAHRNLNAQFQDRTVDKIYLTLVRGVVVAESGSIENYLGKHPSLPGRMMVVKTDGKKSITHWRVAERFKSYTLLETVIKTGRQHQIRVHCANMGHPLAVDEMYSKHTAIFLSDFKHKYKASTLEEERPIMARLTLHAHQLVITHPTTEERLTYTLSLPKDFTALLTQMRKWKA
jgi:23S rRNA pseudouridine1911/1915/1917 synthase